GGDAFGEGAQDAPLEAGAGVQGGDRVPLLGAELGVVQAQDVVFDAGGDQGDLGLHVLRDAGGGVQRDRGPHPAHAVFGDAVRAEEGAGLVGAVDLEAAAAAVEPLAEAEVVEHRADVEQLGVVVQAAAAPAQGAEPVDPPGVVVDQLLGGVPDQFGGFGGQFRVGDGDPGDLRRVR